MGSSRCLRWFLEALSGAFLRLRITWQWRYFVFRFCYYLNLSFNSTHSPFFHLMSIIFQGAVMPCLNCHYSRREWLMTGNDKDRLRSTKALDQTAWKALKETRPLAHSKRQQLSIRRLNWRSIVIVAIRDGHYESLAGPNEEPHLRGTWNSAREGDRSRRGTDAWWPTPVCPS